MILVDSNILMYAAGSPHPNKRPSLEFLMKVADGRTEAAVDAEVLQEVLHRYRALDRWKEGMAVYDHARQIFPVVFAVTAEVLDRARAILDRHPRMMARDALHASVAEIHAVEAICSYDCDFDELARLKRIEP